MSSFPKCCVVIFLSHPNHNELAQSWSSVTPSLTSLPKVLFSNTSAPPILLKGIKLVRKNNKVSAYISSLPLIIPFSSIACCINDRISRSSGLIFAAENPSIMGFLQLFLKFFQNVKMYKIPSKFVCLLILEYILSSFWPNQVLCIFWKVCMLKLRSY